MNALKLIIISLFHTKTRGKPTELVLKIIPKLYPIKYITILIFKISCELGKINDINREQSIYSQQFKICIEKNNYIINIIFI